jgi:hypothetical protein
MLFRRSRCCCFSSKVSHSGGGKGNHFSVSEQLLALFGGGWSGTLQRRVQGGVKAASKERRLGDAGCEFLRAGVFLLPAVFEPEAIPIHFQDVNVIGQPGAGQPRLIR